VLEGSRLRRSRLKVKHLKRMNLKRVNVPDRFFDQKQLALGIQAELNHVGDPTVAKSIAKSRLLHDPSFYKYLAKLEKQKKTNFMVRHIKQKLTPQFPWTLRIY